MPELKQKVYEANLQLPAFKLVTLTWGNVSVIDRDTDSVIIKPSGLPYETMQVQDMVVVDLNTGQVKQGQWKPSSDTPTHLYLYRSFPGIGAIVHTHSRWATIYDQAKQSIPALGTTHADYFHGDIPCTRPMTAAEIAGDYERQTAKVITECFTDIDPLAIPAVLVAEHGPFVWGKDVESAVENAVVLEEIAYMAWQIQSRFPEIGAMQKELLDRHFFRKHGKDAYYGQK